MKTRLNGFGRSFTAGVVMLCMLFSIFAPTIMATTEGLPIVLNNDNGSGTNTKKETDTLNYVSLGASNVNGYGMHGYLDEEVYEHPLLKENANIYGYKQDTPGSYPVLIKDRLSAKYNVNLSQMAISSMRAEEVRFLLDDSYKGDAYTDWRFCDVEGYDDRTSQNWFYLAGALEWAAQGNVGTPTQEQAVKALKDAYRKAVADAELITVDIGANNFGVYASNQIVSNMYENDLSKLDPELATKYEAGRDYALKLIAEKAGDVELPTESLDHMADSMAYALVGFCISFDAVMEQIYKLNPDATVVVVSIQNIMSGLYAQLDGVEENINFGDLFGSLVDAANTYASVLSPYASTYYFADVRENGHVEFFSDELLAYNGDPTTLSQDMKDCFDVYDNDLYIKTRVQQILAIELYKARLLNIDDATAYGLNVANQKDPTDFAIAYQYDLLTIPALGATLEQFFAAGEAGVLPDVAVPYYEGYVAALNTAYDVCAEIFKKGLEIDTLDASAFGQKFGPVEDAIFGEIFSLLEMAVGAVTSNPSFAFSLEEVSAAVYGNPNFYEAVAAKFGVDLVFVSTVATLGIRTGIGNSFYGHPNGNGQIELADAIMNVLKNGKKGAEVENNSNVVALKDVFVYLYENEYVSPEQVVDIAFFAIKNEDGDAALVDFVYETLLMNDSIKDDDRIAIVSNVYFILKAEGVLNNYASMLDIVEKLAACVGPYTTYEQQFALVDYMYKLVAEDKSLDNIDKMAVVDYVYNVVLIETKISAAEKLEVIAGVYAILGEEYFGEYTGAFNTIGNIYVKLADAGLITAEEGFSIVNYVYVRIIDRKVDSKEITEIVTYIYKTLFKTEMAISLAADYDYDEIAGLSVADKVAIIDIVFGELKESNYVEKAPELAPVVELYDDLAAEDENGNRKLSPDAIVAIVDIAFEAVAEKNEANEEVNTDALVTDVIKELATTDKISLAEKAIIANKVAEVVKDSNLGAGAELPELPDLTHITNILAKLDKYITEEEVNYLMGEVLNLLLANKIDREDVVELVKEAIEIIFADLTYDYTTMDEAMAIADEIAADLQQLIEDVKSGDADEEDVVKFALDVYVRVYGIVEADLAKDERVQFFKDLYEAIKDEYDLTDEEVAQIAIDHVLEYYDDAYAEIYKYADEEGYVQVVIDALGTAIDAVKSAKDAVDYADLDEVLKNDIKAELDEVIKTLAKVQAAIEAGNIATVDQLVDTVLSLESDLWAHIEALKTLGLDTLDIVVIPALEEADKFIKTEVIPELVKLAKAVADEVKEQLPVLLGDLYKVIVAAVKKYAPELSDAIYDYLLNNPYEVIEFVKTYGPYVIDFFEEYGDETVAVLGYLALNYGEDVLKFIFENHVEIIHALVYLVEEYGDKAWALIEVYAEATGLTAAIKTQLDLVAQAIREQIKALEEELKALEDLLKDLNGDLDELLGQLDDLLAQLDGAAGELRDELLAKIEILKNQIAALEAQIAQVIKLINQIKAQIAELVAELNAVLAEIDAIVASLGNVVDAIIALVDAIKSGSIKAILAAIDLLKAAIADFVNSIGAAELLLKHLGYLADALADLAALIAANVDAIKDALNAIADALADLADKFADIFDALDGLLDGYINDLKAELDELMNKFYGKLADLENKLCYVAQLAKDKLGSLSGDLEGKVEEAIVILKTVKENYESFIAMAEFLYESATSGSYEANGDDSHYVAIGDGSAQAGSYADLLAEYLGVEYSNLAERGLIAKQILEKILANQNKIADADLITLSFSNSTMLEFVLGAVTGSGSTDWAEYFGEEAAEVVADVLAELTVKIEKLLAEEYDIDLGENSEVTKLAVAAVEAYVYAYVSHFITLPEIIETLGELAPDALIVVIGAYNDLENITIEIEGVTLEIGKYVEYIVKGLNLEALLLAMNSYNVVYVDAPDVETILEAETADSDAEPSVLAYLEAIFGGKLLPSEAGHEYILAQILAAVEITNIPAHVHEYDAICDNTCNTCGAERVAMPHAYYNVCDADCNVCGFVRDVAGHEYTADCDATCNKCGEIREAVPHAFGEWETTRESTYNIMGEKTRTCGKCGATEWELLPLVPAPEKTGPIENNTGLIVAIAIPSVLALGAGGFAAFWVGYKKRSFKELADVVTNFFAALAK